MATDFIILISETSFRALLPFHSSNLGVKSWWLVVGSKQIDCAQATLNCKETTQNRISTCHKLNQCRFLWADSIERRFGMLLFAISHRWNIALLASRFACFYLKWLDASTEKHQTARKNMKKPWFSAWGWVTMFREAPAMFSWGGDSDRLGPTRVPLISPLQVGFWGLQLCLLRSAALPKWPRLVPRLNSKLLRATLKPP